MPFRSTGLIKLWSRYIRVFRVSVVIDYVVINNGNSCKGERNLHNIHNTTNEEDYSYGSESPVGAIHPNGDAYTYTDQ